MIVRVALAAALLLAGCRAQQPEETPQPRVETTAATPPPSGTAPLRVTTGGIQPPADIAGEWRVAGIDGQPIEGDMGIGISIGSDTLSYEPRCLGFAWTYRLEAGQIDLQRDPGYGPRQQADGTVVSCLPAVTPAFAQLATALDAVDTVQRTPANALELTGGGHSVTLFSQ